MFLSELEREAIQIWPRQYVSDELENHERREVSHEASKTLSLALARRFGKYLTSGDTAAIVNLYAPDDCRVCDMDEFTTIRDYAIALYKFAREVEDIIERKPHDANAIADKLLDLVRDSHRFIRDYDRAMLEMPQIAENCPV